MATGLTKKKTKETNKEETGLSRDPWQSFGFPSLQRMRQEFDDLWSKFFNEVPALWTAERSDGRWSFDMEDTADAYIVKAEVPGFEPDDFNIDLRGNQLILQARRSEEKKEDKSSSFTSSEFYRAMSIPAHVDSSKIDAAYEQGVLKVTLPKTEEGKGRRITVKGESTAK